MTTRVLSWRHGLFAIDSLGGMIGQGSFLLENGRQVSPFYVAPWWNENREGIDGLTRGLRGEWPCVPFGYPIPTAQVTPRWQAVSDDSDSVPFAHGFSSHHHWQFVSAKEANHVAMRILYPQDHDIAQLDRRLYPVHDATAIDFELTITARRTTSLPVALHGCFALPVEPGAALLEPGAFASAASYPAVIEDGATLLSPDTEFEDLSRAPSLDGTTVDATRLPFDRSVEDLVQLNGADGRFGLINRPAGYRMDICWDASILPSVVLWYSNRGRRFAPWDGRNLCIGIEPCCTAYGLSPRISSSENPLTAAGFPTAVKLIAGKPLTIRYRIAVAAL